MWLGENVRVTGVKEIAFPAPLPEGWKWPDRAAQLLNMSKLGEFES